MSEGIAISFPLWQGEAPFVDGREWAPNGGNKSIPIIDVYYVDDGAFPFIFLNDTLLEDLQKAIVIIHECFICPDFKLIADELKCF